MHARVRDLCVQYSGYTLPISYVLTTPEPGVHLTLACVSWACLLERMSHGCAHLVPLRGMPYRRASHRRASLKVGQTISPQAQEL
jgi:hypothetical protein